MTRMISANRMEKAKRDRNDGVSRNLPRDAKESRGTPGSQP
jgi:hypothetical protein